MGKHRSAPPEVLESEMTAAGYRLEAKNEFLKKQSFLVFSASDAS